MLEIRERVETGKVTASLTLPFEERQRTRRRVTLSTGEAALLLTPRGTLLRGGDVLALSDGRFVRVVAAPEQVSSVHAVAPRALARVAYHLGNRHVALQVGDGFVRYLHDYVLDDMVRELGLQVVVEMAAFEPEGGAYSGGHSHSHSHSHSHASSHAHSHGEGVHGHGHRIEIAESGGERSEIEGPA